jgi:hypothetical protein
MIAELKARLHLPTPRFWKLLRARCIYAASTLGLATVGFAALPQEHVLVKLGTYMVGGGTMVLIGIATASALAVTDPDCIPVEIKKDEAVN